jgi:hypothetical protein
MLVFTSSRSHLLKSSSVLALLVTFSLAAKATPKIISDEVVQNLSCLAITKNSILHSIKVDEAFSVFRHVPTKNWAFNAGLYNLANCWSLSHAQRLFFYLGRKDLPETPESLSQAANMVRQAIPRNVAGQIQFSGKKEYQPLPWNMNFFNSLESGFTEDVDGLPLDRSFKKDTEAYQVYRFHQILQNIEYISAPRERPADKNAQSYLTLIANLQFNRVTEVLIRPALRAQHVVLAKKYIVRPTGETDFFVYDSNFPDRDNVFTYDPKIRQFTALEIVQPLGVKNPEKPVGVFIVDEGDRDQMLNSLVRFYQKQCED